jgi:hypothetical protein
MNEIIVAHRASEVSDPDRSAPAPSARGTDGKLCERAIVHVMSRWSPGFLTSTVLDRKDVVMRERFGDIHVYS